MSLSQALCEHLGVAPTVYALPEGPATRLDLDPRLESWERRGHPDQIRLSAFIDHVLERVGPAIERIEGPLALRLDVGLRGDADPLWQRDLDNYLYPIVRALPARLVSCWATKGRAPYSSVRIEPACVAAVPDWPGYPVLRAAGSESKWKRTVHNAVSEAGLLPAGPVGVQVAVTVGPRRAWASMWKPTIDALNALLGRTYPSREWNPQDGRVVRLGFHRSVDLGFGYDAEAMIWARSGASDWVELAWLTAMSDQERSAFFAEHDRKVLRARQPGAAGSQARRVRNTAGVPDGVRALASIDEFTDAVAEGAAILITDLADPPKLHPRPRQCPWVTSENFTAKVITSAGKNGRYYRVDDVAAAAGRWPRLTHCRMCGRDAL